MSSLENRIEAIHGLITSESNMKNLSERAYASLLTEYTNLMMEWKREFEPKRPKAPLRRPKADSDTDESSDEEEISRSVENCVRKVPPSQVPPCAK